MSPVIITIYGMRLYVYHTVYVSVSGKWRCTYTIHIRLFTMIPYSLF